MTATEREREERMRLDAELWQQAKVCADEVEQWPKWKRDAAAAIRRHPVER